MTSSYSILDQYCDLTSGDIEPYTAKVQSINTADQIGYYRMNEAAGAVAFDLSPQVNDGAYTAVTLGEAGIGDGETCALFDGATSYLDIASLIPDFDPSYFTFHAWFKVANAAMWTDGVQYNMFTVTTDGNNLMYFCKSVGVNLVGYRYVANGIDSTVHRTGVSSTDWLTMGLTVDAVADEKINYFGGLQVGAVQSGFGTWAGAPVTAVVGAANLTPANVFDGWQAHFLLVNGIVSPPNMARLARL